jgi:iron complex transport system substrate-binding protein
VKPTHLLPKLAALALIVALASLASCGGDTEDATASDEPTTDATEGGADEATEAEAGATDEADAGATESAGFPVDIETSSGTVTIAERPEAIVSLSPTATEILFAIGAGDRVVAVDIFSNYPPEAPPGTLDGFSPDLEAILGTGPDLVVAQNLPDDIAAGLADAGVDVIFQPTAATFDDTYDQVAELGQATGEIDGAAAVNADIRSGIEEIVTSLPETGTPIRVFHEIDDSFYTATSNSFIGQVYAEMGFENVADALDDGTGFPLVDGESIIAADPSLIVFTDQAPYTADDIAARPGWDGITAVIEGNVVQVDADVSSRWGPRIVEFMETLAAALSVGA